MPKGPYSNPWFNVYLDSESSDGYTRHEKGFTQRTLYAENQSNKTSVRFVQATKTPAQKVQDRIAEDIHALFA